MKYAINRIYFRPIALKQRIYLVRLPDEWHIHIYWQTFKTAYRSACVTWFKGKVLNQGLEVFLKLLILSP
jgi:hypothetical protein